MGWVGVGVGRRATGLMGVEVCVVGEPGAVDVLATPGALSKGSILSVIFFWSKNVFLRMQKIF